MQIEQPLNELLEKCYALRRQLIDQEHRSAFRLFNGYYEGLSGLTVDVFGTSLVICDHRDDPDSFAEDISLIKHYSTERFPWITSILVKSRNANDPNKRKGILIYGEQLERSIIENGISYVLDLRINQDTGFYLDTRNLRLWLKQNMAGKTILNTFSYTGSLGVAALASGAFRVIQTDNSATFLNLARKSCSENNLRFRPTDFLEMDFFNMVDRFKTSKTLFDCVILDPPFFSVSESGKVDLVSESMRLINRVRPLVAHDGWLITINNSLFVPGSRVMSQIDDLSQSGYIQLERTIPVPEDVTGYTDTIQTTPPADPSPFNHPTKITILRVSRKDKAVSNLHY
jgi:23S rRNA (cytosine1962-C5)-methyltransferase